MTPIKPDYWEMVKRLAEKHNQQELIKIADDHIEAYKIENQKELQTADL